MMYEPKELIARLAAGEAGPALDRDILRSMGYVVDHIYCHPGLPAPVLIPDPEITTDFNAARVLVERLLLRWSWELSSAWQDGRRVYTVILQLPGGGVAGLGVATGPSACAAILTAMLPFCILVERPRGKSIAELPDEGEAVPGGGIRPIGPLAGDLGRLQGDHPAFPVKGRLTD